MNLEDGSLRDSASKPLLSESRMTLVPLPIRHRVSGECLICKEVKINEGGDEVCEIGMESLVVLCSSMQLPSICLFLVWKMREDIKEMSEFWFG